MNYDGVFISGTYDILINGKKYNPASDGYLKGDYITHVNSIRIHNIDDLMNNVKKQIENSNTIQLRLIRQTKELSRTLKYQMNRNKFSTGLYVQDGINGIGTMTYYNPSTKQFAALGHVMQDNDLSGCTTVVSGNVYESKITRITPSKNGLPGEKIAVISHVHIGNLYDNNQYGVYGRYTTLPKNSQLISTASQEEIKKGYAYFLTVLEDQTISKCKIRITDLKKQDKPSIKGITFEVIDINTLQKANGIVQGMSGSPIIQNGKLIGCVTHVDMHNVHKGYGIYIDWMLENDK